MQTLYEIPNKILSSTFFTVGFYVILVCTVLCALAWIGYKDSNKFWRWVIIIFSVFIVVLWGVHLTTVIYEKSKIVDAYYKGNYYTVEGVVENLQTTEDGGSFDIKYSSEGTEKYDSFIYPHSSGYGYQGGSLEEGMRVVIYYVIYNDSINNTGEVAPKCIVKIETR